MLRRTVIAGLAAAVVAPYAFAGPVGLPGAPDVIQMAASMRGAVEGSGGGIVYVLFTPWCHVSPEIWKATRKSLGTARIKWIPFSGGQPEGREPVERFLQSPSPSAVPRIFTKLQSIAIVPPTPLSDSQDMAISGLAGLIARDTGRGLVTPTIIYALPGDRIRIVPGGISADQFLEIARAAA